MNTIATNVRFPKDEYEKLREFAFSQKRSIASIIRQAVENYRNEKLRNKKDRKALFDSIIKSRISIGNISIKDLIEEGRL